VDYVTGAALALRRDILDTLGFFDEGFYPAYYEEVDFCFRVRGAGYAVRYVPGAVATHHEHAVVGEESDLYLRCFHRNRLRFVLKHRGPRYFVDELAPAEGVWLQLNRSPRFRCALGSVYLELMLTFPRHYLEYEGGWGQLEDRGINAILEALTDLRRQLWSR